MSVNTLRNPSQKIVIQRTTGAHFWLTCPYCTFKDHYPTLPEACVQTIGHIIEWHPRIWKEHQGLEQAINQLVLDLGAEEVK